MPLQMAFWVLMLIWFVFGLVVWSGVGGPYVAMGHNILLFMLFLFLGWHVFGPPFRG